MVPEHSTAFGNQTFFDFGSVSDIVQLDDDKDADASTEYLSRVGFEQDDEESLEVSDMPIPTSWQNSTVAITNVRPVYRPPFSEDSEEAHYISYNPHSGLHNQRIQLENALVLAQLLNRTLLLPALRLGQSIAWDRGKQLQEALEKGQKSIRKQNCSSVIRRRKLANDLALAIGEDDCTDYISYTDVTWDWLIDLRKRYADGRVRIVDRMDLSRAWMQLPTAEGGLGLKASDMQVFDDESVSRVCSVRMQRADRDPRLG